MSILKIKELPTVRELQTTMRRANKIHQGIKISLKKQEKRDRLRAKASRQKRTLPTKAQRTNKVMLLNIKMTAHRMPTMTTIIVTVIERSLKT